MEEVTKSRDRKEKESYCCDHGKYLIMVNLDCSVLADLMIGERIFSSSMFSGGKQRAA